MSLSELFRNWWHEPIVVELRRIAEAIEQCCPPKPGPAVRLKIIPGEITEQEIE